MKKTVSTFETGFHIMKELGNAAVVEADRKYGLLDKRTCKMIFDYDDATYEIRGNLIIKKTTKKVEGMKNPIFSIYDTATDEVLCEDFIEFSDKNGFIKLQDIKNKKFHLLSERHCSVNPNLFKGEYDKINHLGEQNGVHFFSLVKGNKVQLFVSKDGNLFGNRYDGITMNGNTLVFDNEGYKFFVTNPGFDSKRSASPLYDDVTFFGKYIILGRRNNKTDIYWVTEEKSKLIATAQSGVVQVIDSCIVDPLYVENEKTKEKIVFNPNKILLYLAVGQNEKWGLSKCRVNLDAPGKAKVVPITEPEYDMISKDGDAIALDATGRRDRYTGLKTGKPHLVKEQYYECKKLVGNLLACYKDRYYSRCDIKFPNSKENLVSNCRVLRTEEDHLVCYDSEQQVVFEHPDKKQGILWYYKDRDKKGNVFVNDGYDTVEYLGHKVYLVTKDGKKGICYDTKEIFPPIYKSIKFYGFCEYNNYDIYSFCNNLFVTLEKEDGTYEVKELTHTNWKQHKHDVKDIDLSNYTDIQFMEKFIVYRTLDQTIIRSYTGKTIMTLAGNVPVEERKVRHESGFVYPDYLINGKYYEIENKETLKEVPVKTSYAAVYESNYGYVVINEDDEEAFYHILDEMDEISDEDFNNTLIEIYNNNKKIKSKYPRLLKKK